MGQREPALQAFEHDGAAPLHGVSRVHRLSMQLPFVSLAMVVALCKGIVQEQIDDHGPESIEVKRREPLQNGGHPRGPVHGGR
jgi:hypothetical protein